MNDPRSVRRFRACGLLIGFVLVLCPAIRFFAGTGVPCGSRLGQSDEVSGIETEPTVSRADGEGQWTCLELPRTSALRAVRAEQPDVRVHAGGPVLTRAEEGWKRLLEEQGAIVRPQALVSPVLEALRPIVLQI